MAGAASQAGDADSSQALGLNSGLQGSVNVHRGALLLVPQWRWISSFVFYKIYTLSYFYTFCVPHFYDLSALVGCWSSVSIRRIIYKFLNVCPFDYTAVAVSGKVERS